MVQRTRDKQTFISKIKAGLDIPSAEFMPAISRVDYDLFIGYGKKKDPRRTSFYPCYGPYPSLGLSLHPPCNNSTQAPTGKYRRAGIQDIYKVLFLRPPMGKIGGIREAREKKQVVVQATGVEEKRELMCARAEKIMGNYEGKKSRRKSIIIAVGSEEKITKAVAIM